MKRLLVVLSRFPYPLDKGDKLRAYYQIKELSNTFDIYLACTTEESVKPKDLQALQPYCKEIEVYPLKKIGQLFRAGIALLSNQPIQVKMFYSQPIQRKIKAYIDRVQPDHIYCQLVRTTEYVKNEYNVHKTLDYMDALSTGMTRMGRESSFPMKTIYKWEAKRLVKYENLIFDYFDNHTIISEQDRELIYHPRQKSICVIRNGVDLEKLVPKKMPKSFDLVFHGNMSYPPNVASAKYIAEKVMPLLPDSTTLLLSGTTPDKQVLALASDRIKVSGWVDDMRDSYCASKIFCAPMLINTGLQNKILEAMALGIPCITTTMANNAIEATPGKHLIIADTPEAFAESIASLLSNQELYASLQKEGMSFVKERYSWHENNMKLASLLIPK